MKYLFFTLHYVLIIFSTYGQVVEKKTIDQPTNQLPVNINEDLVKIYSRWHSKDTLIPYTGPYFILTKTGGKSEGYMIEGLIQGIEIYYSPDGRIISKTNYLDGLKHGEAVALFPNGQIQQRINFKYDEKVNRKVYYSTGEFKHERVYITGGDFKYANVQEGYYTHYFMAKEFFSKRKYNRSIKEYSRAMEEFPNQNDLYILRGQSYLFNQNFDKAIKDFNRALELEPEDTKALGERAFAIVSKFEYKQKKSFKRKNSIDKKSTELKAKIPPKELDQICSDLDNALKGSHYSDNHKLIEAIKTYCK